MCTWQDGGEQARLQALSEFGLIDAAPEAACDELVRLAADACGTPIASITLLAADRLWVHAGVGMDGVRHLPREIAFCAHAIREPAPLEVRDAREDPRFRDNPLVTGTPHLCFYYGHPLVDACGHALGTLCVLDRQPRRLDDRQRATLARLAGVVMSLFEGRRRLLEDTRLAAGVDLDDDEIYIVREPDLRVQFMNARARASARLKGLRVPRRWGFELREVVRWADLDAALRALGRLRCGDGRHAELETVDDFGGEVRRPVTLRMSRYYCGSDRSILIRVRDLPERRMSEAGADENVAARSSLARGDRDAAARPGGDREAAAAAAPAAAATPAGAAAPAPVSSVDGLRRQLDLLTTSLAHDVRAPLHALQAFLTDMAGRQALHSGQGDFSQRLAVARDAGARIERIVLGLIDYARGSHGAARIGPVDARAVFADAWEALPGRAGAALRLGQLPVLDTDATLLHMVAGNLLSNALKYARDAACASIEVDAEELRDAGCWRIRVRDNGIGFPAGQAHRLFEPFERLHPRHGAKGTGLGLASVRAIVERLGGRCGADNNADGGATFWFTLPRAGHAGDGPPGPAAPSGHPARAAAPLTANEASNEASDEASDEASGDRLRVA